MARSKAKRVVIIALDGISVPGFTTAKTPNLNELLSEGALSMTTRVVMPSVTLPNWTSHLTGSGPEQHGVVNNDWEIDKEHFPAVVTDNQGYYPSVFQILKEEIPTCKTAFYYNWINLLYPYNKQYLDEINYLEKDAYIPNYEKAFNFIINNRDFPTLVFLYSVHTDHAGHAFQWMSPEYIRSIEEADVEIGKLIEKMKAEGLYKDTHFFFLSDHGGINYGHGGMSEDEMIVPWGITGPGIRKGFKLAEPNNTVNTAATILYLFKVKKPLPWTGEVPFSIFK
ncbi:alkaline phosphatase family protein [Phocaeicola faecalis]|uniref:alkaline phosphatase family protein n=1 Tax=Phocaeicola faecalis TaxID=2786956 RepID=UPI001F18EC2B|nr:alkaline phosphatase family protein [Phocaeicola faecalis]